MGTRSPIVRHFGLATCLAFVWMMPGIAEAQPINVITVDCTPFVSPGFSSFGPQLTMGMALQSPLVDPGNVLFNVTEVTPAVFQGMTANQLAAFDLIAINNLSSRLNCPIPDGVGLGTTWHSVVGADSCGGRVLLTSHDAPRFQILPPPFSTPMSGPCPGCEPFGTDELVRNAALWAGSGTGTGLLIFNDASQFQGGLGWSNPELNLPVGWGVSDSVQGGGFADGGYTQILPAFAGHPVYTNVNDVRLAPNSISSFAANISDTSFHSIFAPGWNAGIFAASEVVQNANVVDVGGFNAAFGFGFFTAAQGPDGEAISLIRELSCDAGCTLTQGYWKNHNRFRANPNQQVPWPIDEDTLLCGETWLDNLNTPPQGGDAFYILAHQWIAATLNVADGADDSDVAAEIAEAEALLNSCVFDTSDRDRAIELAGILGDYNEGIIGPGHCDDLEFLGGCGIGIELVLLLPPLLWLRIRHRRWGAR